ncbi:MAG: hypothetical protein KGL61_17105 [Burkholderiales bacterium]|nr:hypothetical protein [Burkholderiales bacterium]
MRIFNSAAFGRHGGTTYHLTIVCMSSALNALRKQLFNDLNVIGLRVTQLVVTRATDDDVASATVTLACPLDSRAALTSLVMRLGEDRNVRRVNWSGAAP